MQMAICDNDRIFRNELRRYIVEYKKIKKLHIDIYEFDNGDELLSSGHSFEIIFLAYQLPNANGMNVARELRSKNDRCVIIFITDHPDTGFESFEVNPYKLFTKPIYKDDIHSMLNSLFSQQKEITPLTVLDSGEQKIIPSDEIIYLEGDGKYCIIRTRRETLHSSKTLSEVFDCLPQHCFFRSHKSFAINMRYISFIDDKTITFTNGEKALISKGCFSDFKKAYEKFLESFYLKI